MTSSNDGGRITYTPIGFLSCPQKSPAESPRQGVLAESSKGVIALDPMIPLEALRDLDGFTKIWLVYDFHGNTTWNALVRPPRGSEHKRGVFATRSPYRPNSIGLSCVGLEKIAERALYIHSHDLLDGTPILDIKPYLPYADSFPDEKVGWLEDLTQFSVHLNIEAQTKLDWLAEQLKMNLKDIIRNQLEYEPTSKRAKRVSQVGDDFVFAYKTWRIHFALDGATVGIFDVRSGYSAVELADASDPYLDKAVHREFLRIFVGG